MAKFKEGEVVRLNTDSAGAFVPAIVTAVVDESHYLVCAFPGPNTDSESLQGVAANVGPVGEGVERYGISSL
jgi:hypothetical protein